jgi:predicted lipase
VHAGFKDAFKRIEEKLKEALRAHAPHRPVWNTGHSLGAAPAVLAADTIETKGIYTFGLPRVGDTIFAGHYNQRFNGKSFRYVNDVSISGARTIVFQIRTAADQKRVACGGQMFAPSRASPGRRRG